MSIPCSKRRFFFSFLSSFLFPLASVKSECLLFSQLSSPLSRPPPPPLPPKQPPTPPPLPCKLHETAKLDHRNTNSANNMKYVKAPTKILKTFYRSICKLLVLSSSNVGLHIRQCILSFLQSPLPILLPCPMTSPSTSMSSLMVTGQFSSSFSFLSGIQLISWLIFCPCSYEHYMSHLF